jgi:hypothetical protein
MSKGKVLVQWSSNWADEMDIEGFAIMNREDWNEYKAAVRKRKGSFSLGVGTNEDIEYDNGAALLEELDSTPLTPEEEKVIVKFFGTSGGFTDFLRAQENEDEDEDLDDDDHNLPDWEDDE